MQLSRQILGRINTATVPERTSLEAPEKVIQLGAGGLLRGLADFFIQKSNAEGEFNGRVVVIKSTDAGDAEDFSRQDGLYTICVRGLEQGRIVEENMISGAISRVLSAKSDWNRILDLAKSKDIQLVISNTTEVGLRLEQESIHQAPPKSFPAKLLALLYARYKFFQASRDAGLIIIPTELIPDNGKLLRQILIDLCNFNKLEPDFIGWLQEANEFCSSLVDRIVPGRPPGEQAMELEKSLGYEDKLLLIAEPYRLWAIEGSEKVKKVCSFETADPQVIIAKDISPFRELKLRLLNGTHTLTCGLAYLAGFRTVKEGMQDPNLFQHVKGLMTKEILPVLPSYIDNEQAHDFARNTLERFANPFIQHHWINITLQYSSKMKMRNVPILLNHYKKNSDAPKHFATGFAAYLLFMKSVKFENRVYYGETTDGFYPIQDDEAAYFMDLWHRRKPAELVKTVLQNQTLWGEDLSALPGFAAAVLTRLEAMLAVGVRNVLKN